MYIPKSKTNNHDRSRAAAAFVLKAADSEGSYANIVFEKICADMSLEGLDRSFSLAVYKGTISYLVNIDAIIKEKSKVTFQRIDPIIKAILRTAVWQIMYSEKIPDHSVCDESVKIASAYTNKGAVAFTNGILRSIVRDKKILRDRYIDDPREFYLKCSMPPEIAGYFKKWFGMERALKICGSLHSQPMTCIRVNGIKSNAGKVERSLREENIEYLPGVFIPYAYRLQGSVEGIPAFSEGGFAVQDEAAMLVSEIADPAPGDTVIDLCSAPGGKACHMADLMRNKGKITAIDIHASRLDLITQNAKRLGVEIIEVTEGDSSVISAQDLKYPGADVVLADVPCSGLGILRRKPDILMDMDHKKIISLYETQKKILVKASQLVKTGGYIVYSTCTLNPEENEIRVGKFMEEIGDAFEMCDFSDRIPPLLRKSDGNITMKAASGMITLYPDKHGCDGFFIAKIRRIK